MVLDLLVVLLLVLLNGFLAMSELAIVSSRRSRLQTLADRGRRGARLALALAEHPGHFLSAVQIGITLVGLLAGVFSGTTLAEPIAGRLLAAGLSERLAQFLAYGGVVGAVTYLTLVAGELVPKQLALRDPEAMASLVAPAMHLLTRVSWPFVVLLEGSSRALLTLLGGRAPPEAAVTGEEIRALIAEAESAGVMPPQARSMIAGVMRLGERNVRGIMTPRQDVDWIDLDEDAAAIFARVRASRHSRMPVGRGAVDVASGVLRGKDLLDAYLAGREPDPRTLVQEAPVIIDSLSALQAMEVLRGSGVHMVLVVDEYGVFQGLITTTNILEAIAGAFPLAGEDAVASGMRRDDGSWLLDGDLPVDEMAEMLGILLPARRTYHTVAGLVLARTMHIPQVGESFTWRGWRFEVVDMDDRRIDKVLAVRALDRRQLET